MTLQQFLDARYTEDETFFRESAGDEAHQDWALNQSADLNDGALTWAALRILDEITANRHILELHTDIHADFHWEGEEDPIPAACAVCEDRDRHEAERWPCRTLRALAGVYAEHEDYQPGWAL